jgi:exodeoxyribonuclease VII large subunit
MTKIYNPTELSSIIKNFLPNNYYNIIGEVIQPKFSNGHLYFTIKDTNTNIKAIIWKHKNNLINSINEGDKVTIQAKLDYYSLTGNINLIVNDILVNDGIGEIQQKILEIKAQFEKKGYFNSLHKLPIPNKIKNILIITSKNGAALQDFLFNISNTKININYDIYDVPVQGIDCPKLICEKIKDIYSDNSSYDLIIITRGGGSITDLIGFSQPELIEHIYNYKRIPILSAIGHQVDNPLLDLIADISCPTPSLASQFIIDTNRNYIKNYEKTVTNLKEKILLLIYQQQEKLIKYNNIIKEEFNKCKTLISNYKNNIIINIIKNKEKLNSYSQLCNYVQNNQDIILLDKEYNQIKNNYLELKDFYYLKWGKKKYKIKIISEL